MRNQEKSAAKTKELYTKPQLSTHNPLRNITATGPDGGPPPDPPGGGL